MAENIRTNGILSHTGNGTPNYISPRGGIFVDTNTPTMFISNGDGSWIDIGSSGSNTGSTTDIFVTGGTYSGGDAIFTNNTGGTFSVSGFSTGSSFTGGTVTGATNFTNGLTANTISATTISATTFYGDGSNLTGIISDNFYTTGGTITNGIISFDRNDLLSAYTVDINSFSPDLSGYIPYVNSTLTGNTDRIVQVDSGGTVTATTNIIQAYLVSGSTTNLLDDVSNWDINGVYTGTTVSNTYQGQKHYNSDYFFEAVDDNIWIRLIRG
jgi:hypothetical protein